MLRGTADRTVTYLAVVMLWMPPKLVCSLSEREWIKDMLKAKDAVSGRSSPVLGSWDDYNKGIDHTWRATC